MNTSTYMRFILALLVVAVIGQSCVNDLDTVPLDPDVVTAASVYDDPESYRQVLAKLYGGLALSGQQGPAGQPDIEGIDEGFGQYLRGYWYHQELSTDEALIGWNDQTIADFHGQSWTSQDGFIFAFYSRIFYLVVACNEFLRETTDSKLNERGVDDQLRQEVQGYRAEARFLRALSYWHALDLFRNVPFVTENDAVGAFFPQQIQGNDLFDYIESELLAIESEIATVRTNDYARADQGAVWALLAKLYLNAEVYTGTARYNDCLEYSEKIIGAGYELDPSYSRLFLADNHTADGVIFPIAFDGVSTRTYGGTTFIIRAGIGGSMDPTESGVSSGWGGTRTTKEFVGLFPEGGGGQVIAPNPGGTVGFPKVYIPGDYQGWDPSNTVTSLSSTKSDRTYEGYKYFPEDNMGFRVHQVPANALIYGDNDGDGTLEPNGDTIRVGEAGLYRIFVDFNDNTYTTTRTEWGVVGDATPGGWENDTELVWNEELNALEANLDLTAGVMKFRANGNWDINLGDDDQDAILTQDGADIRVAESNNYQLILYLEKPDYTYELNLTSFDGRGFFYTEGQNLEVDDVALFTDGYAINKFKNVTSEGELGSDIEYPDTDFPMFRYADVLLSAAEAILRSGGNRADALDYVNQVRARAFGAPGTAAGNISDSQLDLDFILDERARELYWECHRRTDLVRFGQFSDGDYLWTWKGGVKEGTTVSDHFDVYPLPVSDINANPNLEQNRGY